MERKAQDALIV